MTDRAYRVGMLCLLTVGGLALLVIAWRAGEACREASRAAAEASEACREIARTAAEASKHEPVNPPPGRDFADKGERPAIRFTDLNSKYDALGESGRPLGELVTLQGLVVDLPRKGPEFSSNLRVQRINGRATQEDIHIKLESLTPIYPENGVNALAVGKTYEVQGFEQGVSSGFPAGARRELVAESDLFLTVHFVVLTAKEVPEIRFSPADFLDRFAVFEGTARTEDEKGYLVGNGWKLLVLDSGRWPQHMEGKPVEVEGVARVAAGGKDVFRLDHGKSRLVNLEDQLGREVELKGEAWSLNFHWWFRYRGVDLYVEDMKDLPNWNADNHGRKLIVSGVLDEALLPRLDQISLKEDRDLKKYFIVRKASWRPIQRWEAK